MYYARDQPVDTVPHMGTISKSFRIGGTNAAPHIKPERMVTLENKSTELKIRIAPELKLEIENKARSAGLTTSEYVRAACGPSDKIIILEEGKLIAQKLCEIYTLLETVNAKGYISSTDAATLTALLKDNYKTFNDIYDRIPAFLIDTEEED